MSYTFRPAVRENVNLLIGLGGGTGSGKTYTGMRLASGMAGAKRFAVIDTENGRASHYADQFKFDVAELHPPFTPAAYAAADAAAAAAASAYAAEKKSEIRDEVLGKVAEIIVQILKDMGTDGSKFLALTEP